jgi:hypothetical protein
VNIPSDPESSSAASIQISKPLDFIASLTESNLIRTKQSLRNYTGKDISELVFLYLVSLEILRHEEPYASEAKSYAAKTVKYGSFSHFYPSGNDLYLLLHTLFGERNQEAVSHLKLPEKSAKFLSLTTLDQVRTKSYLRSVAHGSEPSSPQNFFLHAEQALKISVSNYRSIRRLAVNWSDLDRPDKKLVMTRLLQAFRTRLIRSELKPVLERYAKDKSLEIQDVNNAEQGDHK